MRTSGANAIVAALTTALGQIRSGDAFVLREECDGQMMYVAFELE